jgi:hypothetical protein
VFRSFCAKDGEAANRKHPTTSIRIRVPTQRLLLSQDQTTLRPELAGKKEIECKGGNPDAGRLVRLAYCRFYHEQKLIERDCAFRNTVTSATVNDNLSVVVEDIHNEERLFLGTSRRCRVHADFEVSDPRQRNGICVTVWAAQKADVRSGNSQCCKIVFQRTAAHGETSRLMVGRMIANSVITGRWRPN